MPTSTSASATLQAAPSIYTDGTYLAGHGSWHQEDSPWKAAHIKAILERNGVAFTSLCEVGCGAGEILNVLSHSLGGDKQLYGYEISPQAFELCRGKAKDGLTFRFGDVLAESEQSFDVLMAIDVFEHVEDYLGFLKRLKPKGDLQALPHPARSVGPVGAASEPPPQASARGRASALFHQGDGARDAATCGLRNCRLRLHRDRRRAAESRLEGRSHETAASRAVRAQSRLGGAAVGRLFADGARQIGLRARQRRCALTQRRGIAGSAPSPPSAPA